MSCRSVSVDKVVSRRVVMTRQEVINQVSEQLERADFTRQMVSVLRTATGNVLNRAKQSLDATLEEGTNNRVEAVLADVTNNMTSATQEWIDESTNNLVVFPEGTRFISKDNDSLVILVEQKPQQRRVSYKQIIQSPTGGFTFLNNNYFVSLPFIQFIAKFVKQNNGYRFVELYMSCSKNPVESLDQHVNALIFPNIHHTNLVCIGSMANLPDNKDSIVDKMNHIISSYWDSQFNTDLSTNAVNFFNLNNMGGPNINDVNLRIANGFAAWQDRTAADPMFIIKPEANLGNSFRISSIIPSDNSSRSGKIAIRNRMKHSITTGITSLGSGIIQSVRDFNLVDENRDKPHVDTLKACYKNVIQSAYSNIWEGVNAIHEQKKTQDEEEIVRNRSQIERERRSLQTQQQNLERDRLAWQAEKTRRENELAVAYQYLQRKLQEIGSSVQQSLGREPVAPVVQVTPVVQAESVRLIEPVPQVNTTIDVSVATVPNPPGYSGRGRPRAEAWQVGSVYRKKQADGSYLGWIWNGNVWLETGRIG